MPVASNPSQAITGLRIKFASEAANYAREVVSGDDLFSPAAWSDPVGQIEICCVTDTLSSADKLKAWMAATDLQAVLPFDVKTSRATVYWRPGRALVQAESSDCELILPAIIDFAFYEGELRKLERLIVPYQVSADADVVLVYQMSSKGQSQWDRLYRTMEELYRLRLRFARLEPHLYQANRSLPIEARRIFSRLIAKSQVVDRLEAFSDQLEACEDLYEGAVDRITDFRLYRKGNRLEIAIVILLAVEVVLLLMQMHHS